MTDSLLLLADGFHQRDLINLSSISDYLLINGVSHGSEEVYVFTNARGTQNNTTNMLIAEMEMELVGLAHPCSHWGCVGGQKRSNGGEN